jgi:protein-S-isoprenylcysteine O-methyltransferase Ste14
MLLNGPTLAAAGLSIVGVIFSVPVLAQGFKRRGTGTKYQKDFLIQRAPQYASIINIFSVFLSFLAFNHIAFDKVFALSAADLLPTHAALTIAYIGVFLQLHGFVFMIGGWYSLGEYFTTDAELLQEHKVKNTGLLKYVMHPCYSGIVQSLLGVSIAAVSPLSLGLCLFLVAPLWFKRARYEEALLLENLGQAYNNYAQQMKWRRIVPLYFPLGF